MVVCTCGVNAIARPRGTSVGTDLGESAETLLFRLDKVHTYARAVPLPTTAVPEELLSAARVTPVTNGAHTRPLRRIVWLAFQPVFVGVCLSRTCRPDAWGGILAHCCLSCFLAGQNQLQRPCNHRPCAELRSYTDPGKWYNSTNVKYGESDGDDGDGGTYFRSANTDTICTAKHPAA